jgi:exonuclease III
MSNQQSNRGRTWKVLCWNVRGINSSIKWNSIRNKIKQGSCDIICLQKTKRSSFDLHYLENLYSLNFDCFDYIPSEGSSGGIITIWKGSRFSSQTVFKNNFAISIEFTVAISGATWILSNIYAPCSAEGRTKFLNWFENIDMPDGTYWLIVGDFNLIRRLSDRDKAGGNVHDMMAFNAAISRLGLEELKLYDNKFTWTNKQESSFLERLDWFFTSTS